MSEHVPRCQFVSPTPWGPAQCVLLNGHGGGHAYSPSEAEPETTAPGPDAPLAANEAVVTYLDQVEAMLEKGWLADNAQGSTAVGCIADDLRNIVSATCTCGHDAVDHPDCGCVSPCEVAR